MNENYNQMARSVQKEYKEAMQTHQKIVKEYENGRKEVEALREEEMKDIDGEVRFYYNYKAHQQKGMSHGAVPYIPLLVLKKNSDLTESIRHWITITLPRDKPARTNSVLEEYKQSLQINAPHSHRYQQ